MFEFLEELAAIASDTQSKCKKCGFITEKQEHTENKYNVRCPKCGEKDWEET